MREKALTEDAASGRRKPRSLGTPACQWRLVSVFAGNLLSRLELRVPHTSASRLLQTKATMRRIYGVAAAQCARLRPSNNCTMKKQITNDSIALLAYHTVVLRLIIVRFLLPEIVGVVLKCGPFTKGVKESHKIQPL